MRVYVRVFVCIHTCTYTHTYTHAAKHHTCTLSYGEAACRPKRPAPPQFFKIHQRMGAASVYHGNSCMYTCQFADMYATTEFLIACAGHRPRPTDTNWVPADQSLPIKGPAGTVGRSMFATAEISRNQCSPLEVLHIRCNVSINVALPLVCPKLRNFLLRTTISNFKQNARMGFLSSKVRRPWSVDERCLLATSRLAAAEP